ncbi:hypothetical protein B296_00031598 [Ensete ventricosum]|uniref:Uncharacterized protein n=1 Tax=Ensete ventricosum TaxID=4639 RepID=A0A426YBR9_ENSVE|nr:hypothetical protein B296_00031598 [Ensete ventricosum]
MGVLEPIISLDRISFKVYSSNVHHRYIWGLVVAKITFHARDPPNRVSFFPSRKVHPHAWVWRVRHKFSFLLGASRRSEHDAVGNSSGVCRELTEGIESLPGWHKGVRQEKTEIHRKIIDGSQKACRDKRRMYHRHPGFRAIDDSCTTQVDVVPSSPKNPGNRLRLDRPDRWLNRPYPIFRVAFGGCTVGVNGCTTRTQIFRYV